MLIKRNGAAPVIDTTAVIAPSAVVVGDVRIGARCYVDHGVTIESAGPPIEIRDSTIVFAGSVIRSIGGSSRPAFGVAIGSRTLVAPHCVLTGCQIGNACYLATGVTILQGATIGNTVRVGVGAIVHFNTHVPEGVRIGMRHVAVPTDEGFLSTADVELARRAVTAARFFVTAFDIPDANQAVQHDHVIQMLLNEVHGWKDEPL
jgi:carbonic anhydrase/acetyltransferase-like protein (isoleucine patch superfamily)